MEWLNHLPEKIDPVAFYLGFFQVRYYSLMLFTAFISSYLLVFYRLKKEKFSFSKKIIDDYLFWLILALIAGGRLGYVLFYNFSYYFNNPLEIILPFRLENGFEYVGLSGLSYHGSLIAIVLVTLIFCWRRKIDLWQLADLFSAAVPLGHFFGRIGNFLNGELYGRVTNVAWGMYFPSDLSGQLRHPSQLYQAFFEGLILFFLLWAIRRRLKKPGLLFSFYLAGYGLFRFVVEFFRQPDPQLGFIWGPFTLGQLFCLAMVIAGLTIFFFRIKKSSIR